MPRQIIPGGEWFIGAGLGLFVHWDHASAQGIEIGWPIVGKSIIPGATGVEDAVTAEQYHSSAPGFNPTEWDARALAAVARQAGASYVVFTARHHGGHSMWHTRASDYSIENTPFGRDIVREYVEAVRAEGLRVGLYYSLSDWHHPDYPAFMDSDRPYPREHHPEAGWLENVGLPVQADRHRRPSPEQWESYLHYVRSQLSELLTEYGPIDLLWFDGDWERSAEEWDSAGLRELIKGLQPHVIINERLPGQGDYYTPEQSMPAFPPDTPWEMCLTIGDMWGWRPTDTNNKSVVSLLTSLVEAVALGGNLLLNTGIRGDGSLNPDHVTVFRQIGAWMAAHGESVKGVVPVERARSWAPMTARSDSVYVHLITRPIGELVVRGLAVDRIRRVSLLATEATLDYSVRLDVHHRPAPGEEKTGELRVSLPDSPPGVLDVVHIELDPT